MSNLKTLHRKKIHKKIRSRVFGTAVRPRLSVFRSLRNLSAQLINDDQEKTLISVTTATVTDNKLSAAEKVQKIGEKMATEVKKKKIKKVVFDRGGFKYAGKVKIFADSVRKGGIVF